MQAHIDRLERVDELIERARRGILAGYPVRPMLADARQVLRLTIDDLSLEDGAGDAAGGPTMSSEEELANHEARLGLIGDTIHQMLLSSGHQSKDISDLRLRVKRLEKQAGKIGLAASFGKILRHDVELLREEGRRARLAECWNLYWKMHAQIVHPFEAVDLIQGRICELEQAGGGTDDEQAEDADD